MLEEAIVAFAQQGAAWVLWVLVALSVASGAVMIERGVFYAKRNINITSLAQQLGTLLDQKDVDGAKRLLGAHDGMEASVLKAGLDGVHRGPRAATDLMEAELVRQKARFDAWLIFLGTLGNNAPFVGLLGTVLGIIKAFKDLAVTDIGKAGSSAQIVMSGISEALVATAVGLAVALPAVIAFNYFKTRVKRAVSNTETLTRTLSARLEALQPKAGS
jgi:biopolymer transport protein ExbB/TolQ